MNWPQTQPVLETSRLMLRPLDMADAETVRQLAGEYEIASTTLLIPHPYELSAAHEWLSGLAAKYAHGVEATFAITLKQNGELIGAIGLVIEKEHDRAEMGYWIGKPYWCNGYCTEAARRVLQFAFEELQLNRVAAHHFARNPASGRVMEKIGLVREGYLPQHIIKWGKFEDIVLYGLTRDRYIENTGK